VDGLAVLCNLLLPVFSSLYAVPIVILYPIFTVCCWPPAAWAPVPQQIRRVIMLASIPTVLAGLRLGGALAIVGVVVSEMHRPAPRHRPD